MIRYLACYTLTLTLFLQRQPSDRNGKEIQMLVQRSQVGSVIGRGGYKIKETREVLRKRVENVFVNYTHDIHSTF